MVTLSVVDGVLVIDKPRGITSHDVVSAVRRLLREPRVGHAGTLDPLATGVLVLVCGRATRLVRFFSASHKSYEATIVFGVTTDSYDVTGTETSRSAARPSREAVEGAVASLSGEYLQEPPAFSAKKVAGARAYALARQQKPVALAAVPVQVTEASVRAFDGERATVTLTCSAGFYVRSFAHALGQRVGCGAALETLRRTRSGEFTLEVAVPLDRLSDASDAAALVTPLDRVLRAFPGVQLSDEGLNRVRHGRVLALEDGTPVPPGGAADEGAGWVRLLTQEGRLVAMAERRSGSALHPSIVLI